jgi:hypothetical protein
VVVFGDSAYTGQPVEEKREANGVNTVIVRKGLRSRAWNEADVQLLSPSYNLRRFEAVVRLQLHPLTPA